jgi:hypothetical protein
MSQRGIQIAAALAACAVAAGCGPRLEGGGGRFGFDLFVEGVLPPISQFQIALLTDDTKPSRDCATVLSPTGARCLRDQGFELSDLVPLLDAQKRQHPAILLNAQPTAMDGGTQDVQLTAAVGNRYTLVIEALSTSAPPQLLGTSCTYLPNGIRDGDNGTVLADPMRSNPDLCDPRWEK